MVFMGSNKIMSNLKLKWLHKQCFAPLNGVSILMCLYLEVQIYRQHPVCAAALVSYIAIPQCMKILQQ